MEIAAVEADIAGLRADFGGGGSYRGHLLQCGDTIINRPNECVFWITHGDGSYVTRTNPAEPGEEVSIYATGLGRTFPIVEPGMPATAPTPVEFARNLRIVFYSAFDPVETKEGTPARTVVPSYVGLTTGKVGIYRIDVKIPEDFKFPSLSPYYSGANRHRFDYTSTNVSGALLVDQPGSLSIKAFDEKE